MTAAQPDVWDHPAAVNLPSQALHPAQVTSLPGYNEHDVPTPVKASVEALEALTAATTQVITARLELRGNPAMAPAAALLALDALQTKLNKSASQRVDNALQAVKAAIQSDERALSGPVNNEAKGVFASELRSVLRAMPVADRMAAINKAVADGDVTVASAVLGAPPLLSGVQPASIVDLSHKWHTARNPAAAARLALLRATEAKLLAAGSHFVGSMDAVLGATPHALERARSARAKVTKVLGAVVPQE